MSKNDTNPFHGGMTGIRLSEEAAAGGRIGTGGREENGSIFPENRFPVSARSGGRRVGQNKLV